MFKTFSRIITFPRMRPFSINTQNQTSTKKNVFEEELAEVNSYYPKVKEQLCNFDYMKGFPGLKERYEELLDYTVNLDLRMSTCLMTLYAYKRIEKPENQTKENLEKAYALSWALRMIEAGTVVVDDVIDESVVRYGQPSWYKKVGLGSSILDSYVLEHGAYMLIYNQLKDNPYLPKIFNLIKESTFKVCVAVQVDIMPPVEADRAMELCPYRYNKSNYMFNSPVRSTMYLSNIADEDYHEKVQEILVPAGQFHAIQNDYWEVYAPYAEFKKNCDDIPEGRNTWLHAKALEVANPAQKKILQENYGKPNEEAVQKVKDLFNELKMEELYLQFTEEYFADLHKKVDNLPPIIPKSFFHDILRFPVEGFING